MLYGFIVIAFVIGIIVGRFFKPVDGLFIVDDSDSEVTRWTIDVKFDPKTIPSKKEVRLKVKKLYTGDV